MQLIITMSTQYKFIDNDGVYFTTSTIAGWTDACLNRTVRFLNEKFIKQSCWIASGIASKARV